MSSFSIAAEVSLRTESKQEGRKEAEKGGQRVSQPEQDGQI